MIDNTILSPVEAEIQYQHCRRETATHAATCDVCNALSFIGDNCEKAKQLWLKQREALKATLTEL